MTEMTPERLAEIRRQHFAERDVEELIFAYEAQARALADLHTIRDGELRSLAAAEEALAQTRAALEKISGPGAWDAAHIASEALAAPVFRMIRDHADDCGWLHGSTAPKAEGGRGDCGCGAIVLVGPE